MSVREQLQYERGTGKKSVRFKKATKSFKKWLRKKRRNDREAREIERILIRRFEKNIPHYEEECKKQLFKLIDQDKEKFKIREMIKENE